jgi:phenylpropionate dioxygenase-like ring-hydroxylating dioxygenase large terminal subunit
LVYTGEVDVPFGIEVTDRARKERYYDADFYRLEAEQLWSRVWQMACRLEEIPEPGDFVEYEILDQSVVVVRAGDGQVRAFQNACRHRGVKVVEGRGSGADGFTCPFHGWCYGLDGANTHIPQRRTFDEHNLQPDDVSLTPVRCELWGGCAWINLDEGAPPLRECIEPAATILDAWKVESLRTEWWYACRLPVNWKLAQEAFQEQYHVVEAHPQLVIPGMRYGSRDGSFDPRRFVDAELQYLRTMSEGMAGMVHATDVKIAEGLRDVDLPAEADAAMAAWYRGVNDAVVEWHRSAGHDIPDLNELEAKGLAEPMGYVFPHWFVLPMYSSASSYRFRPLGPEETLMEIWSLTRYREGRSRDGRPRRRSGSTTTPAGRRSRPRTSRTSRASSGACTSGASSTCASPRRPRATCRTSSGSSTATSPAFPTTGCSRRSARSTSTPSSGRSSISASDSRLG